MSDAYASPDMPDISQMTPATGRVGAPPSGTYGEGGPLQALKDALPAPTPGLEQGGAPPAGPTGGRLPLPPPSGALPRGIMAPTARPLEPMTTPLAQPIPVGENPTIQTRQLLEAWARDPALHETTRAWAQANLDRLGS